MENKWSLLENGSENSMDFGCYAILILNQPLKVNHAVLASLWQNASWRVTVDGGTDRWLDFTRKHNLSLPLPNHVTGDFDSIKPETLEFCKSQESINVVETPDQNYTDFEKAINIVLKSCPHELTCFVAITENEGRIDQTIQNVNTLSKVSLQGFILGHSSLTWLLKPGAHRINIPLYLREISEWCGILPFHYAKVSTTGLKWNLDNTTLEFGGLISSSNTYDGSPEVTLTTDRTVIWAMGLGDKLTDKNVI